VRQEDSLNAHTKREKRTKDSGLRGKANAFYLSVLSPCSFSLFFFLIAGCSTTTNSLTLLSTDHRRDFEQKFSHAYAALDTTGDYDVVLVHDANADSTVFGNGPMQPAPVTPRQVVHIRIYWVASHESKLDHPAAANASIRWYLFGDRLDEQKNFLEYSGGGLVLVSDDGKTAWVTIRGAFLKAVARRGEMVDPLGPSSVSGTFTARVDRRSVQDVLKEVNDADGVTAAESASAVKQ
jgi:hypothetical protein